MPGQKTEPDVLFLFTDDGQRLCLQTPVPAGIRQEKDLNAKLMMTKEKVVKGLDAGVPGAAARAAIESGITGYGHACRKSPPLLRAADAEPTPWGSLPSGG